MNRKKKYVAPLVLEDIALELEAEILESSNQVDVDPNFEKVETTGQEIGGVVGADQWTNGWN